MLGYLLLRTGREENIQWENYMTEYYTNVPISVCSWFIGFC